MTLRNFDTGATRDTDEGKLDYEGFLSHEVLESYAEYMHVNRVQADGKVRDADNWQKGIPEKQYMKSMYRHFMAVWKAYRTHDRQALTENLNALLFNVMGMQFENLRRDEPTEFNADGTVSIGPGAFASADGNVISWQGENYYRPKPPQVESYHLPGPTDHYTVHFATGGPVDISDDIRAIGEGSKAHVRFAERAKSRWND